MAVVKNMMVRVGADFSSLIQQSKKASSATSQWAAKTNQAFSSVSGVGGSLSSVGSKLSGLGSNLSSVGSKISGTSTLLSGLKTAVIGVAGVLSVKALVDFGKQCVELGSDAMAAESTFSTVFGDLEAQAEASLTSIAEQAGSTADAMRSSFTQIAAFAKTTGVSTSEALELTTRATTAAADIAAFYDSSIDDVTDSLQSFLKGNYENDAALGLSCTETTRNAAANELYGKSFANLSEAQKQLTLMQMVEDANTASGALGQAARECDTWAIQSQYLAQQAQSAMASIGQGLINLLTPALRMLNRVMAKVVAATKVFQSFTAALMGADSSSSGNSVSDNLSSAADSASSLTDSLAEAGKSGSSLDDATGVVSKSLGKTSKAAAALKRTLEGFDQITRLSEEDSGGTSTDSGTTSGASGVETLSDISDELDELATSTAIEDLESNLNAQIENIDWKSMGSKLATGFGNAIDALNEKINSSEVKSKITTAISAVTDTINGFFETITFSDSAKSSIAYRLGDTIGDAASLAMNSIDQVLTDVEWSKIGTSIAQSVNGTIDSLSINDINLGSLLADKLNAAIELLDGFASEVHWSDIGSYITDNVNSFFANTDWKNAGATATELITGLEDMLDSAITNLDTEAISQAIADFFSNLDLPEIVISLCKLAIDLAKVQWSFTARNTSNFNKWLVTQLFGDSEEKAAAKEEIAEAKAEAALEVDVSLKQKWTNFTSWLSDSLGTAKDTAIEVGVSLKKKWTSFTSWLNDALGTAKDKAIEVGVELKKKWSSLSSWVGEKVSVGVSLAKNGWKSLSSWVGTKVSVGISLAKKGWTSLSSFIGKFTKTIGLKLTWTTSGLGTLKKAVAKALFGSAKWPKLSFAARGGIVNGATLLGGNLVAGEAGAEAIVPLENHTEWLDRVADRLAQKLGNTGSTATTQPIQITVTLDGKIVGQSVVNYAIGTAKATGQLPWAAYT